MIYITGDCHGDYRRFSSENFPEQKRMGRNDYVIVCGDFGYWSKTKEQEWWRDWLSQKPFTLLWVDGNHENYDMIKKLPVTVWHGGKAQFVAGNIIHLMRGQVFSLGGYSFFTFGGARSHDIQDGILNPEEDGFKEKYSRLRRQGAMFRVNHVSWWEEEMPNAEEMEEGRRNLDMAGWKVDYIVSHCAPSGIQNLYGRGLYETDILTDYFDEIRAKCDYARWFFGHYHENFPVTDKEWMLYEQIIRIDVPRENA